MHVVFVHSPSIETRFKLYKVPSLYYPYVSFHKLGLLQYTNAHLSITLRELLASASQANALSNRLKKQATKSKEYDRRASKDRRIRYVPIPELLGFMVSVLLYVETALLHTAVWICVFVWCYRSCLWRWDAVTCWKCPSVLMSRLDTRTHWGRKNQFCYDVRTRRDQFFILLDSEKNERETTWSQIASFEWNAFSFTSSLSIVTENF